MNRIALILAAIAVQGAGPAPLGPAKAKYRLNGALTEISGFAPAGATSVYAHNDEVAVIYELDIETGAVLHSHALGDPPVAGDFEGIAAFGGFVYLVTSKGLILEARLDRARARSAYNIYDTGVGGDCEVEGIASTGKRGEFYLACKRANGGKAGKRLIVYKWSYAERLKPLRPHIDAPIADLAPGAAEFRAADLARDTRSGNLLIVDSSSAAIIEITPTGAAVGYWRMDAKAHPQAEGLAVMPDGTLLIGDEGRIGGGFLTVYPALE